VQAGDTVVELERDTAELNLENAELAFQQAEIELDRARRQSGESLEQAQSSLQAAASNLRNLRDQLEQVRALVDEGAAARNDLTNLEAQVDSAESQFVQARDGVARAERSEEEDLALLELRLEQARVARDQSAQALEETQIDAPFDGVVAELLIEAGEFAAAGSPAFRLQSDTERELVFNVAPEDAAFLLERGTVRATYAGRELSGRIVSSARPSQQARLVEIRATFDTDGEATVPTGATAQVSYTVPLAEGYLVPSGALTSERGQTYVFVAEDGVATRKPVTVLGESTATAAIDGVSEDDAVIVPLPLDVREGTLVRVVQ
jgi:multidrug efflux pump subunit AcrA (membrane-fusion protein)